MTMYNEEFISKANSSNFMETKKKPQSKFIKTKGIQDHQYGSSDQEEMSKKIQELTEENILLHHENKTLQLQNKKAIEFAIENKNAKILKYNSFLTKSPPKSISRSPKSKNQRDLGIDSRKSREVMSTLKDTYKENTGFYGSNMSVLITTGGINSRLPSGKKSRNSNSFSADKNAICRSNSLENVKLFKKKITQNVFKS